MFCESHTIPTFTTEEQKVSYLKSNYNTREDFFARRNGFATEIEKLNKGIKNTAILATIILTALNTINSGLEGVSQNGSSGGTTSRTFIINIIGVSIGVAASILTGILTMVVDSYTHAKTALEALEGTAESVWPNPSVSSRMI